MAISADLGDYLEEYVNQLVTKGRYNSKSEVLREGVRLAAGARKALGGAGCRTGARAGGCRGGTVARCR